MAIGLLGSAANCAENEMTVQISSEPTQFDPFMMEDGVGMQLAANTIASPYEYDSDGNLKPALVEKLTVSRDHLRYTFRFKKNLKWSDGVSFQSSQFMLAIKRVVNEVVRPATSQFFPKIDLKRSRAIDALTVEVVLLERDPLFTAWCTLPAFAPLRPDMLEIYQSKRTPVVPTLAAYQVVDYKRDEWLQLKANPLFYDQARVSIQDIKIRIIKDEAALYSLLKAGSLDIVSRVPALQLEQFKKISTINETRIEGLTYLGLNVRKPPFNELKNRQFFRDAVVEKNGELAQLLKTGEIGATTFIPALLWQPGFHGLSDSRSPGELKRVDSKLKVNLQSDNGSRNLAIMEFVQSICKKSQAWSTVLDIMDFKTHYAKLKTEPNEAYRFGWLNPVSDPYVMYQVLMSKSPNNFTGWANADYDQAVEALRRETVLIKRGQWVSKIESILYREAPVVPLLHQVARFGISKRVLGFHANPFGVMRFREFRLTPQ